MSSVGEWLAMLGLGQYATVFADNFVDMAVLPHLTEQDLRDIGIHAVGHRRRLSMALRELQSTGPGPLLQAVVGEDIAAPGSSPPAAAEGERPDGAERRHLTVMFCDLVGSTALSARLDPEDMRDIFRAYQERCAKVIAAYEGFVAQYRGDGIMAYFGYPQAHEDDAERAVRAGLDLAAAVAALDTPDEPIEVRIGIATGVVVVGDMIGEGAARERSVVGETPNLAARLQTLAAPGAIVVGAATRRLLGGLFELRDLGARPLKGFAEPVQAWAVVEARSWESRFEARVGGLTGFVGRAGEAALLLERKGIAWKSAGQVVLISGEAGIGKSRLTAWLGEQLAGEPHVRLRYQCTPHHTDSPLYPAITQTELAAALTAGDTPQQKLDKLEGVTRFAGLVPSQTVPLFAALLAIPLDGRYPPLELTPGQQRQRTLAALLGQIVGLAQRKPMLLVFEDAHWADPTSLELLEMIVERIADLPVLAIVTGRPEFAPRWAARAHATSVGLGRLDHADARTMVELVAGGAALPSDVLDQLVAKTDGVPLFVEELTKTVLESGLLVEEGQAFRLAGPLPTLAIPATLQDSLMARLDRSNPVKDIAQIGAAIGREFSYELLLAVAGMDEGSVRIGLAKLEEAELASRDGIPPRATYTFKHALVQDAAYESLLKSRRQTIHGRIADVLRDRFPAVLETEPEIVAHHATQAGRTEQALGFWAKAGDLALRRSAHLEAISHLERAIDLAEKLDDTAARRLVRVRLQIAYGQALLSGYGYGVPRTIEAFARARELAEGVQEPSERFAAYYGLWAGSFIRAEPGPLHEMAAIFQHSVAGREGTPAACVGYRIAGVTRFLVGDYVAARGLLEQAVEAFDETRDAGSGYRFGQNIGIPALYYLAFVLWPMGEVRRACDLVRRGLAIAEAEAHVPTLTYALACHGMFETMRLDHAAVSAHARNLDHLSREHALPFWTTAATMMQGWVRWHAGEREAGEADLRRAEASCRQQGIAFLRPRSILVLAEIEARSGRPDQALRALDTLAEENQLTRQTYNDAELARLRGTVYGLAARPDTDAAQAAFRSALTIARTQQTRTFALRAALDLTRLQVERGRPGDAPTLLREALAGFEPACDLPEAAAAASLLASLD